MNFPKSQMLNTNRTEISPKRSNKLSSMRSGYSKNPITANIPTATKKINPTKKAFIYTSLFLYDITVRRQRQRFLGCVTMALSLARNRNISTPAKSSDLTPAAIGRYRQAHILAKGYENRIYSYPVVSG
jgi:hypothetical protein